MTIIIIGTSRNWFYTHAEYFGQKGIKFFWFKSKKCGKVNILPQFQPILQIMHKFKLRFQKF